MNEDRWNDTYTDPPRDHFARPAGGFTTPDPTHRCAVCGKTVGLRGTSKRVWTHIEEEGR